VSEGMLFLCGFGVLMLTIGGVVLVVKTAVDLFEESERSRYGLWPGIRQTSALIAVSA